MEQRAASQVMTFASRAGKVAKIGGDALMTLGAVSDLGGFVVRHPSWAGVAGGLVYADRAGAGLADGALAGQAVGAMAATAPAWAVLAVAGAIGLAAGSVAITLQTGFEYAFNNRDNLRLDGASVNKVLSDYNRSYITPNPLLALALGPVGAVAAREMAKTFDFEDRLDFRL